MHLLISDSSVLLMYLETNVLFFFRSLVIRKEKREMIAEIRVSRRPHVAVVAVALICIFIYIYSIYKSAELLK